MARMTKAQREELAAKEEAEYLQACIADWPKRMMELLERAAFENFEVIPDSQKMWFTVKWVSNSYIHSVNVPLSPTTLKEMDMSNLEFELSERKDKREEAERKAVIRNNALAKLTKEERDELGV